LTTIGVVKEGICRTPFTRCDGIIVECGTPAADHPSADQGKEQLLCHVVVDFNVILNSDLNYNTCTAAGSHVKL
jgi:hypothetical protein